VGEDPDPGSGNVFDPGSGMEKIRFRDKHPGSATLLLSQNNIHLTRNILMNAGKNSTEKTKKYKASEKVSDFRCFIQRVNMELDLQSVFGLHVYCCTVLIG
jgi:hypothetical protein